MEKLKKNCAKILGKLGRRLTKDKRQLEDLEFQVLNLHGVLKSALEFQKKSKGNLEEEIRRLKRKINILEEENSMLTNEIEF